MATKYYKKLTPQTKVVLSNRAVLEFTSLDGLTGYFATDQEFIQNEFNLCMAEQRYCISEIDEKEFIAEYLEKKNQTPLRPVWREEFGKGQTRGQPLIAQHPPDVVAAAVGVKTQPDAKCGVKIEEVPPVALTPAATLNKAPEHIPPLGKRKRTTAPT